MLNNYRKKSKYRLQLHYLHLWQKSYLHNVVSYDFLYKFQYLNISDLILLSKSPEACLNMDISTNLNNLHGISDSLLIFGLLTNQKSYINSFKERSKDNSKKNMETKTKLKLSLIKNNFFYFINMFICYIFPVLKKRKQINTDIKLVNSRTVQYFFDEFNLCLNSKYDFLENKVINLNINFNFSKRNESLFIYYLNLFNL